MARLPEDLLRLGPGELVGRIGRLDPPVVVLEVLLRHAALNSLTRLIRNVGALVWVAINSF